MEDKDFNDGENRNIWVPYLCIDKFKMYEHPGNVVETASLSCVSLPQLTYKIALPETVWKERKVPKLSGLQLEVVGYAGQAHAGFISKPTRTGELKIRRGFVCADGPGVGKGRTIAAVLADNYLKGRTKAIWVTVSQVLMEDAKRDLVDLTGEKKNSAKIFALKKDYGPIKEKNGILFLTYSTLSSIQRKQSGVFVTRVEQVVDWATKTFDGPLIFDEVHAAKNYDSGEGGSKIGQAVVCLQEMLPMARVMYVSATIATDVEDIQYMERLGLWESSACNFVSKLSTSSVAFKELIPIELKERGLLLARQLSLEGIFFASVDVKIEENFRSLYDDSCLMWMLIYKLAEKKKNMMSIYWAQHQRFFKGLCTSSKIKHVVETTKKCVSDGKSVIIGLQSTGEAALIKFQTMKINDQSEPCSSARTMLEDLLINHLKVSADELGIATKKRKAAAFSLLKKKVILLKRGKPSSETSSDSSSESDDDSSTTSSSSECTPTITFNTISSLKTEKEIISAISNVYKRLKEKLPPNPLDELIRSLGGPEHVSEMTGRTNLQMIQNKDLESRAAHFKRAPTRSGQNLAEMLRFQRGSTFIAVISEAASTGISLHSSKIFKNQRQRVHIILEIPWSATSAVQQMGRSNRSNQVHNPEYLLMKSAIPGEQRFVSSISDRMRKMGAISRGDEQSSDLEMWSCEASDPKIHREGLRQMINAILGKPTILKCFRGTTKDEETKTNLISILKSVGVLVEMKKGLSLNAKTASPEKFLNRVLGVPLKYQKYLVHLLATAAKRVFIDVHNEDTGGIKDLEAVLPGEKLFSEVATMTLSSGIPIHIFQVRANRGLTFEKLSFGNIRFKYYEKQSSRMMGHSLVYAVRSERISLQTSKSVYYIYEPFKKEKEVTSMQFLTGKIEVDKNKAQELWNQEYEYLLDGKCVTEYSEGICLKKTCSHSKMTTTSFVTTGSCSKYFAHLARDLSLSILPPIVRYKDSFTSLVGIFLETSSLLDIQKSLERYYFEPDKDEIGI